MTFRTRFDFPRVSFATVGDSLARQEFKDESDVNYIIKRYQQTGVLIDPLKVNRNRVPQFGDVSGVPDLQTAFDIVSDARERLDELPDDLARQFAGDPDAFVAWLRNPANRERAFELGFLINSKAVSTATPEPATPTTKPAEATEGKE